MMENTAELNVSREGMIASMKDSFTNKDTFIKELMQNARRAGASTIWMTLDEEAKCFTITDDGAGITSPHTLLNLGQSGWSDAQVMAEENPFGVGFAAAIFVSDAIRVRSQNWVIDTDTESLLAMKPIAIRETEQSTGTSVTLTLTDAVSEYLFDPRFRDHSNLTSFMARRLAHFAIGFPIPVYFNGEAFDRKDAIDQRETVTLSIGAIDPCLEKNRISTAVYACYYQGFFVGEFSPGRGLSSLKGVFSYRPQSGSTGVIHLDNAQFRARMPDRDNLIDEREANKKITQAVNAYLIDYLRERDQALDAETFLRHHGRDVFELDKRLLADKPVYRDYFFTIDSLPFEHEFHGDFLTQGFMDNRDPFIRRGDPLLLDFSFDDWFCESVDINDLPHNAILPYARALGWPILEYADSFREIDHWAVDEAVDLEDIAQNDGLAVSVSGEQAPVQFVGEVIAMDVRFCNSYTVTPNDDRLPTITIDNSPMLYGKDMLVPKNATYADLESILRQINTYTDHDNEVFDDAALKADTDQLAHLHRLASSGDYAAFLSNVILDEVRASKAVLKNRTFTVSIDSDGWPNVTEN